jgi:S1-C subfamily serine protease
VFDFAVIKVYGAKLNSCPVAVKEPNLGMEIFVYGYPKIGTQGSDLKVTKGIVSGVNGIRGDKTMFQMDAAIQPGNSGGPIVSKGKIIGLTTLKLVGDDYQNVNLGIKSSKLYHLLHFFDVDPKPTTNDFSKCTYLLYGEE